MREQLKYLSTRSRMRKKEPPQAERRAYMQTIDFPSIHIPIQGMERISLPRFARIRAHYPKEHIENLEEAITTEMAKVRIDREWIRGKRIAITVGSRGIPGLPRLIRQIGEELRRMGARPFIVPAMGSHGGGTAEGNLEILKEYGITSEQMGVPICSGMEVELLGYLNEPAHIPVYCDRYAAQADGILVFNKVKPHTDFKGEHESGLCKMLAIGLAKHKGCSALHMQGFERFAECIPAAARLFLEKKNVFLGIGVIQNAYDQIAEIRAFPREEIMDGDHQLLEKARLLLPRLKFDHIDVLIIDRIGKNISGEGTDPNVTGRGFMPYFTEDFHCKKLFIRGLTEESHGNACGLGLADITTRRCLNEVDWESTWINLTTNLMISGGKIPMYQNSDEEALRLALRTCPGILSERARIARIHDTTNLFELEVSEELLKDVRDRQDVEIVSDLYKLCFDKEGFLEDLKVSGRIEPPKEQSI